MSLFDYPRINITGTLQLNPGTANNDDYAQGGQYTMPSNWGPFAGQTLGLVESAMVEARTYGMSDADFIAWVQQPQTFNSLPPGPATQVQIPSEWNYYGDMGSKVLSASVVGVQTGPGASYDAADASVPLSSLIGATLAYSGGITDLNSQGSPPATQFFIDQLTLTSNKKKVLQGQPSKGACQWINFYRNVNQQGDSGAGGYEYHVIRKGAGTVIDLPGFDDPNIEGVIFRYYLFNIIHAPLTTDELAAKYAKQQINPAPLQFVATIAPLYKGETIITGPTGRLLVSNTPNVKVPAGTSNNNSGGFISLGPAVLQLRNKTLSAEFVGTFPDYYHPDTKANPKYDFGPVQLSVSAGANVIPIGMVDYAHTAAGDARGWIFDFDLSNNADALSALQGTEGTLSLTHPQWGTILSETDFYVVTNAQAIYGEQHGPGDAFRNQGTIEPATVEVYSRGVQLPRGKCPPITVWQYRSIPIEAPGNAQVVSTSFQPGDPLRVDTSYPGNYLFTFTVSDTAAPAPAAYPPKSYLDFMNPPWITNAPGISLRILPNDEDFSRYYVDPSVEEATGNDLLTFDVVYQKVLRTYYLLFPAMNKHIPLNNEARVTAAAGRILGATEFELWMTTDYMPRTRDMSMSRRRLLRAWCRKVS
jgi:hypothetical protein